MGLIRGGSLDNAIVLTKDGVMNGPLRFSDEFGRHKALDLIGDLALVGLPLLGRVEARKAGHALHTQLVTRLLNDPSSWTITTNETTTETKESSMPLPALLRWPIICRKVLWKRNLSERLLRQIERLGNNRSRTRSMPLRKIFYARIKGAY